MLDLLAEPTGTVQFELEFFRDAHKRYCVRGRVWGRLRLVCQRCLEPVEVTLDSAPLLALVRGHDEATRLPGEYDPLLVGGVPLHPLDLVEDEILLALPQIPVHPEEGGCAIRIPAAEQPSAPVRPDHPFQVLGQLKTRLH